MFLAKKKEKKNLYEATSGQKANHQHFFSRNIIEEGLSIYDLVRAGPNVGFSVVSFVIVFLLRLVLYPFFFFLIFRSIFKAIFGYIHINSDQH